MDRDDRIICFVAHIIVIEFIGLLFSGCLATPQFNSQPQFVQFQENKSTPIGTLLFNLTATDYEHPLNNMTILASGEATSMYVNVTQRGNTSPVIADVILKKLLDRESNEGGIDLTFSLKDAYGNSIFKSIRLYILDECDESPQYDRPSYTLEINEVNITGERLVFDEIRATDRDNGYAAVVTYHMEPKTDSKDYWTKIYNETFRMDPTTGNLYLTKNLDYENNSFYQFTLFAHDTCNLTAQPAYLRIIVKDVQDRPPFFIGLPYTKSIMEGTRDNTALLRVTAIDGDLGIPNAISYFLSTSTKICHDHFVINASTGEIVVTAGLYWGMEEMRQIYGVCTFIVEAREMDKHPENQRGKTVSSTTVTVTILRSNSDATNLHSCVFNLKNCSCICTEQKNNVGSNTIIG